MTRRAAADIDPGLEPAAPPALEAAHGDGQFDHVDLAPGLRAAIRVTPSGDIVLLIPGGELTITPGACQLGLGLLEATRRAAEIRVRHAERARRRGERPTAKTPGGTQA